ncbi:MAG: leucine-rich repeat domain-containing protein [Clostridia bacterium]|nr:leucine-rich repeat domain-containing protein [Clostridia bacterium]
MLFLLLLLSTMPGCTYDDNPDISTSGIVDKIGEKSTAQNSYNAVKPTPNRDVENIQNSTAAPYDPVINFTDPYFESVVRDLLGKSIGDIKVSDVSSIKTLTARVKGIRNINDIVYFTSLEELDLYGNKISDITPIAQLVNLRVLNIGKNYNTLYSSNSSGTNGINLNILSSLPLLEELYAEDNQISDLSFVEGLSQIKILNLSNNNLTDVTALSNLKNLEKLILLNNKITDLVSLTECVKLNYIDVSNNYYEVMDEQTLFYTGYGIKDLSFAEKLANLTYINVSMNMVSSLESLSKLKELRTIYADDNYITDISYFKDNSNIQLLSVKRNYIKDFNVITSMKTLTELFYIGNPIDNKEPVLKFESQNF